MALDNPEKLQLTGIRPDTTHEEAYQAIVAALKRQGLKVIKDEERKPKKST
jgi:hypothetical protein